MDVLQLLQGCTYDFAGGQATFNTLSRQVNTESLSETGNYTVIASGSNTLSENQAMLAELVSNNGNITDSILLLSGDEILANTFKTKLLQLGASAVSQFVVDASAGNNPGLSQAINQAVKILFLANSTNTFNQFLNSDNGEILRKRVHQSGMITAFIGDDSRFGGKTVVDNYYELYAS